MQMHFALSKGEGVSFLTPPFGIKRIVDKCAFKRTKRRAGILKSYLPLSQNLNQAAMAKRYEELEKLVAELVTDLRKFYDDGNKAAGTRARKALLALKNWAHEVRKEISAQKAAAEKPAQGSSEKPAAKKAPPKKK